MSPDFSADAQPAAATRPPRPKFPYPGLRPFEADEWPIFFGREAMIDEVIDRLANHRLVLIHGSSGAGKSSLVRAGVLPTLARQFRRAGASWQTCTVRPSGGPLWNLAKGLAGLEGTADDAERVGRIVGEFSRRHATLSSVAGSLKNLQGQRLCLLIDQFEELFRFEKETSREQAELFVDLLVRSDVGATGSGGAGTKPKQEAAVHVVVTMRSEFLGDCARFDGLAEAVNRTQYLVPRMDREALLRAIRRPAQLYGGEVTLDLAERLVAEAAGHEDELPLIQHGLMLMWYEATAKIEPGGKIMLDVAPLEAAGGLAKLLSSHADAVVAAVAPNPERYYVVERLFRALTDVNVEGKGIRRPQAFRELAAVTEASSDELRVIIDSLRCDGVSFLTPYPPQPIEEATPIDISHEALIRCWERLADVQDGWLKREFDDGLIWRSLLVEARTFQRNQRSVLSPATTAERSEWWEARKLNEAWAERHGDNLALVERLLIASRKTAATARLRSLIGQFSIYGLFIAVIAALAWINQDYFSAQWRWYVVTRPYIDRNVTPWVLSSTYERHITPGTEFRECETDCPQMVVVPSGSFVMGSPANEPTRFASEGPQHNVDINRPFAVSSTEVTFAEWDACVLYGGCDRKDDAGWGRGQRPATNVSWTNARQYVSWISTITGKPYRLLTEAEYEYAARAGTTTAYPWGDDIGKNNANCDGCGSQWDNRQTAPVGSFPPNKFRLYDVVGNVWEWVEDCWHNNYVQAPADGSAWSAGGDCGNRTIRGGSWNSSPTFLRSAARNAATPDYSNFAVGFRIARSLPYFAGHPTGPFAVITGDEAALPSATIHPGRGAGGQAFTRGPTITIISPASSAQPVTSPFILDLRFDTHAGTEVDTDSVLLTYLKQPEIDITQRIKSFVTLGGIDIPQAEMPPGLHQFLIQLQDKQGQVSSLEFNIEVAK
jgi:formylglycine-generating enzyme required for sulfatase activity